MNPFQHLFSIVRKGYRSWVFPLACLALAFLPLVYRSLFGLDWSDEGYYAALSYRFLRDRLLIDSWDIHQTSAILVTPFCWLYREIAGSTEGIILFLRILYLIVKALGGVLIYLAFKRKLGKAAALIAGGLFLIFTPFDIPTLSYNTLSLILHLGAACLLWMAVEHEENKKKTIYAALAGVLLGLSVIAYPAYALLLLLYPIILVWVCRKRLPILWMLAGAGLVFIIFGAFLLLRNGVDGIIQNIGQLFGEEDHQRGSLASTLGGYFSSLLSGLPYPFVEVGAFVLLLFFGKIRRIREKMRTTSSYIMLLVILLFAFLSVPQGVLSGNALIFAIGIYAPLVFFLRPNRTGARLLLFFWLPAMAACLAVGLSTSNTDISGSQFPLLGGAMCTLLLPITEKPLRFPKVLSLLAGVAVIGTLLVLQFAYVYRDQPVGALQTRMERGPYRGIYTTVDNASVYDTLNTDFTTVMRQPTAVVACMPWAYLCADQTIPSHTVWLIHPDSDRLLRYYLGNETHRPRQIVVLGDVGVHNRPLLDSDPIVQYLYKQSISMQTYRYFQVYQIK